MAVNSLNGDTSVSGAFSASGAVSAPTVNVSGSTTTNGVQFTKRGVPSGTDLVVGGRAFASSGVSETITGGTGGTDQAFSTTYLFPVGSFTAQTTVQIRAVVKALSQNGTDNFQAKIKITDGTTTLTLAQTAATDIAANDHAVLTANLTVYGAPAASASVVYSGQGQWTTAAAASALVAGTGTLNTTLALTVTVTIAYQATSDDNTSQCASLVVLPD